MKIKINFIGNTNGDNMEQLEDELSGILAKYGLVGVIENEATNNTTAFGKGKYEESFKYFVAYKFESKKQTGHGMIEITSNTSFDNYAAVVETRDYILANVLDAHKEPMTAVVITNFILLK